VVSPVDRDFMAQATMAVVGTPVAAAAAAAIATETVVGGESEAPMIEIEEAEEAETAELFTEELAEVTSLRPIENFLKAGITTYTSLLDRRYGYFRLRIERAGAEILPVMPKDVILVQDCSASIAEQRLHFCREGLAKCLGEIQPQDRFNVMRFRDKADFCFADWTSPDDASIESALAFISGMVSEGNTDILTSIQELAKLPRTAGRPTVVLLVTDGHPTTGLVGSSDIIGQFSKLNDGAMSVFAMGTVQTANEYLLDLLSYSNRGDDFIVTRGRWDIPDAMARFMKELSRPVLADVGFRFAEGSGLEVYPVLTSNLYLDRPLVLYGRYPKGADNVVFQAVGNSGEAKCDMIFSIPVAEADRSGDKSLRREWAMQKIYHLMGQYARTGGPTVLRDIRSTARDYGVDVPYREDL